jgi:hypothetical protein
MLGRLGRLGNDGILKALSVIGLGWPSPPELPSSASSDWDVPFGRIFPPETGHQQHDSTRIRVVCDRFPEESAHASGMDALIER